MFDLERIKNEGLQLGSGMKTDGHMISVLFDKTALNFVPQNQKETQMQKARKNISNWSNGMYPLYKNPYGITEDDRIIGIDPGMMIDSIIFESMTNYFIYSKVCVTLSVQLTVILKTNKQTTKQHPLSISNASYKMRFGMPWLKQKGLKSRATSNIQTSYDRLQTRNVCTNEGVMQYLNSFSRERTQVSLFL